MKRDSILKNFNYNFLGIVVSNLSFALGVSLISRKLGPEGFGVVNSFISFIAIFTPLIIHGSTNYYMREYSRTKSQVEVKSFLNYTFSITFILVALLSILFAVVDIYEISIFTKLAYILILCISQALDIQWIYRVKETTKKLAVTLIISSGINIILLLVLFKFLNIEIYLLIVSITKLINSLLLFYVEKEHKSYSKYIISSFFAFTSLLNREFLKTILPPLILSLSGFLNLIYVKADVVLLTFYGYVVQAGLYSSAYTIIQLIFVFRSTLLSVLLPSLINAYNTSLNDYKERLGVYFRFGALLGVVITGSLFFSNKFLIILLFGKEYLDAIIPLNILLVMNLVVFLNMGLSATLIVIKKDKEFLFATLIAAVINIFGNLIFIPAYNMIAAAVTTLCSELIIIIYSLILLQSSKKEMDILRIFFKNNLNILLVGLLSFGVTFCLNSIITNQFNIDNLYIGLVFSSVFVVIFSGLVYALKLITKKEIKIMTRVEE